MGIFGLREDLKEQYMVEEVKVEDEDDDIIIIDD